MNTWKSSVVRQVAEQAFATVGNNPLKKTDDPVQRLSQTVEEASRQRNLPVLFFNLHLFLAMAKLVRQIVEAELGPKCWHEARAVIDDDVLGLALLNFFVIDYRLRRG